MPDVEYVIYPGMYVLLNEQLRDGQLHDRLDEKQWHRIVEIVSAWEGALQEHGDDVQKVVVYREDDGELSLHAFRNA